MNTHLPPPRDYVLRVARRPARDRYARLEAALGVTAGLAVAAALSGYMVWSASHADAAIADYAGVTCHATQTRPAIGPDR